MLLRALTSIMIAAVTAAAAFGATPQAYTCESPAGLFTLNVVQTDTCVELSLVDRADSLVIFAPSRIALVTDRPYAAKALKEEPMPVKRAMKVKTPFYRQAEVEAEYWRLRIPFSDGISLEVRVFDDGFAYRWVDSEGNRTVIDEVAEFAIPGDPMTWSAYTPPRAKKEVLTIERQLHTDMQGRYIHTPVSQLDTARLIYTPMLVDLPDGRRLAIAETDVTAYPGMYLMPRAGGFKGYCAREPSVVKQGGHNDLENLVAERHPRLMQYTGPRTFPWRVFIVTRDDRELADNDMLYRLAPECRIADTSWIKPGKVAWEWWCAWTLRDVDFEPGINTPTYKAFIDFAAENNLEYVILDEGWATKGKCDLFDIVPEIDLPGIVSYAESKGVGIILWAGFLAMERQLDEVAKRYSEMGVKGFKVDFLNRDDAEMMRFMERCAEVCAEHKLLVDFHGCTKPTGLQCAWPNVVNFEAVFGLEQMKWTKGQPDIPEHDLVLPFTRLLAGPMDYTQGAMRNFAKGEYRPDRKLPGSQGTRTHQLAEYVIFDAPLTMLCDSPSDYRDNPECVGAIARVPTVWDETRVLAASVGEYLVEARRSGDRWWIAGMTNWTPRTLSVNLPAALVGLTFDVIADGSDAATVATDFTRSSFTATTPTLEITMAPGGGYFAESVEYTAENHNK